MSKIMDNNKETEDQAAHLPTEREVAAEKSPNEKKEKRPHQHTDSPVTYTRAKLKAQARATNKTSEPRGFFSGRYGAFRTSNLSKFFYALSTQVRVQSRKPSNLEQLKERYRQLLIARQQRLSQRRSSDKVTLAKTLPVKKVQVYVVKRLKRFCRLKTDVMRAPPACLSSPAIVPTGEERQSWIVSHEFALPEGKIAVSAAAILPSHQPVVAPPSERRAVVTAATVTTKPQTAANEHQADNPVVGKRPPEPTPLIMAVLQRDYHRLHWLLCDPDIDVNAQDADGKTALYYAVLMNDREALEALLENQRVNPDIADNEGNITHMAMRKLLLVCDDVNTPTVGVMAAEEVILSWGPRDEPPNGSVSTYPWDEKCGELDVNAVDAAGNTRLIQAVLWGDQQAVAELLQREEVAINAQNRDGQTALAAAVCCGEQSIASLLLATLQSAPVGGKCDEKLDVNRADNEGNTPLVNAVILNHHPLVEQLLQYTEVDVNAKSYRGNTALAFAVAYDNEPMVQRLLQRADIDCRVKNDQGHSPLAVALLHNNKTIITRLLDAMGIATELAGQRYPLLTVLWLQEEFALLSELLALPNSAVNDPDSDGCTLLIWAAGCGDESLVQQLLQRPDVLLNHQDDTGWSALACAATRGQATVVERLLQHHDIASSLTALDDNGKTVVQLTQEYYQEMLPPAVEGEARQPQPTTVELVYRSIITQLQAATPTLVDPLYCKQAVAAFGEAYATGPLPRCQLDTDMAANNVLPVPTDHRW